MAAALLQAVGTDRAQVVPMDGFHLANVELQRLGRAGRKGAPDSGAIAVLPSTQLVITEGNYLLHDVGPWAGAARLLDETWYVDIEDTVREQRLVRGHRQFGRSAEAALALVASTDAPNARLIVATKSSADHVLAWS